MLMFYLYKHLLEKYNGLYNAPSTFEPYLFLGNMGKTP